MRNRLRQLLGKASEGPWTVSRQPSPYDGKTYATSTTNIRSGPHYIARLSRVRGSDETRAANADLIAEGITALPVLLDAVDALITAREFDKDCIRAGYPPALHSTMRKRVDDVLARLNSE